MISSNLYCKYRRKLKFSLLTWEMAPLVIISEAMLNLLGKTPCEEREPYICPILPRGQQGKFSLYGPPRIAQGRVTDQMM